MSDWTDIGLTQQLALIRQLIQLIRKIVELHCIVYHLIIDTLEHKYLLRVY